ncbi:MAG: ribosome silencing factor [Ruminococcaceae bacterium]|nr:ribosome silencing factor [Oscillospiraceae bacterium]
MTSLEKTQAIVKHLDNKKAKDIKALQVSELTLLADYFVICSAQSSTQVKALADTLEEEMEKKEITLFQKEGKQGFNWILMDYSDVIVHIFYQETREFYGLEKLWSDAVELNLDEIIEED